MQIMPHLDNRDEITTLLNQVLQPRGITATVKTKDDTLKILLLSSKSINLADVASDVLKTINSFEILSINRVRIYACQEKVFDIEKQLDFQIKPAFDSVLQSESQSNKENSKGENTSSSEFSEVLEECSKVAREAYQKTLGYYNEISTILSILKAKLKQSTTQSEDKITKSFEFSKLLSDLDCEIENKIENEFVSLKKSLVYKRQHLEDFTIVLFGRTKAGKSTIREALTCGDGSSIGTGSQRTTRDTHEYRWKGLRLIDTPGIEAYKGEEDKQKALAIVQESDMVIFLVTDESVQTGEFDAIRWLKDSRKYFFILMNVKYEIDNPKKLKRFMSHPEKIFDLQRLEEHKKHIEAHFDEILSVDRIDIAYIHAHAAFLSTLPQYTEYRQNLWELSRIEEAYSLIASEIKANGSQRRWNTLLDGVIYFIDPLSSTLREYESSLKVQIDFMKEKREELEKLFRESAERGYLTIERKCKELFGKTKEWVPHFVEDYIGKDSAQAVYEHHMEKEKQRIEDTMSGLSSEIVDDLISSLAEFQKQYEYDMGTIRISPPDLSSFQEWKVGKVLKWVGVGLSAASAIAFGIGVFAAANFWNPVGWAAGITSMAVGFFSWIVGDSERKAWRKKKQDAKEFLWKNIDESEREFCSFYQDALNKNITLKARTEIIEQVDAYIRVLSEVEESLLKSIREFETLRRNIERSKKK